MSIPKFVNVAAFGWPVVPDVKNIATGESGLTDACRSFSLSWDNFAPRWIKSLYEWSPDVDDCLPVRITCFNVGKAFDESSRDIECWSSSGTSRRNIDNESIVLTHGERIMPLHPTLFIEYSSSRPT